MSSDKLRISFICSRPVPVVTIQDILNATLDTQNENQDDTSVNQLPMEEQIQHFSERVMNELKTIATWLTENRKGTDYMSIYSQVCSTLIGPNGLGRLFL